MIIPQGFTLLVVSPERIVVETIELGEMDLDKPFAKADVVEEIQRAVKMALPNAEG